jgi:hypothetical protein
MKCTIKMPKERRSRKRRCGSAEKRDDLEEKQREKEIDTPFTWRLRSIPLRPDPIRFFRFRGLFREQLRVSV